MIDFHFERIGLVLVIAAMAMMVSCTAKPFRVATDDDNGTTIEIPAGQILAVKLKAQLGTGFSWAVTSQNKGLAAQGSPKQESGSVELKAGGFDFQVFSFKAQAAGSEDIVLLYKRPFDADAKDAKEYRITVVVK